MASALAKGEAIMRDRAPAQDKSHNVSAATTNQTPARPRSGRWGAVRNNRRYRIFVLDTVDFLGVAGRLVYLKCFDQN